MAKENNEPGAKYPIVKASFDLEASKRNYQVLLQNLSSIQVTRDNVNEDLTKDGREVLKALEEEKDRQSAEPLQWHRDIMTAYKASKAPLEIQVDRILVDKKALALVLKAESDQQLAEQTRINTCKAAIVTFCNKVAVQISEAKTDDDIVTIEKMIGSEKTKKNLYQEFLPDLIIQCDGLRPQIKDQKENIRELEKVKEKEKKALDSGDPYEAAALRGQREQIESVIAETGIRIHEKAFEQASTIEIIAPEIAETIPKGRTNWKWRVDDIKTLQKKMPHLVKLVPNEEAIKIQLETMKKDESLKGKDELQWNGITFFNDKSFTR